MHLFETMLIGNIFININAKIAQWWMQLKIGGVNFLNLSNATTADRPKFNIKRF
jgi:hypothetical protein